jgi:broad specificity phosphatase PhoE
MPTDLVLVRHGSAEGNLVFRELRKGNPKYLTPSFIETHESKWRLTAEGRNQAIETGRWIQENIASHFGRYLTSEYVRAIETAALLNLPGCNWERAVFLRERNFGRLSALSYEERQRRFHRAMEQRKRDAFFWVPPSGESLADLALRVDYVLDSLAEANWTPNSAIVVSHFNVMGIMRARLEMITQKDFDREVISDVPHRIWNGSVVQYTRKNPTTGEMSPVYKWVRFATPWMQGKYADPKWEEIQYQALTNEQILKDIEEQSKPVLV